MWLLNVIEHEQFGDCSIRIITKLVTKAIIIGLNLVADMIRQK